MAFENDVLVCFSGAGKVQTAFGTALAQSELDTAFNATVKRPYRVARTERRVMNCKRTAMARKRTTTLRGEGTLEMEVNAKLLTLLIAWGFGVEVMTGSGATRTHTITLTSSRNMPVTSMRVGVDDGVDTGKIYKDVAIRRLSLRARSGPDSPLIATVEYTCHPTPASASGTTWPACFSGDPLLLSDCTLTATDATPTTVDYSSLLKSISWDFDPRLALNEDPFVNSVTPTRIRRQAERQLGASVQLAGDPFDANYTLLTTALGAGVVRDVAFSAGVTGNIVTLHWPEAWFGLADDRLEQYGEMDETVLNAVIDPADSTGAATKPMNVVAVLPTTEQAIAFLTPA